ncbi:hypothetical protein RRG08_028938 [Elysia crispata]|uniref:Secreted protein n=1 Tax=Elysia crispata TaxID=231223 RepID=A0AAE1E352_9GAST|nr:hypothetical protein RRG08_028938 [Elysia crispata]
MRRISHLKVLSLSTCFLQCVHVQHELRTVTKSNSAFYVPPDVATINTDFREDHCSPYSILLTLRLLTIAGRAGDSQTQLDRQGAEMRAQDLGGFNRQVVRVCHYMSRSFNNFVHCVFLVELVHKHWLPSALARKRSPSPAVLEVGENKQC